MSNPLAALVKPPAASAARPWKALDGTVDSIDPLEILLDGDLIPTRPSKSPIVGSLAVGDRVLCHIIGTQLIVMGSYGGSSSGSLDTGVEALVKNTSKTRTALDSRYVAINALDGSVATLLDAATTTRSAMDERYLSTGTSDASVYSILNNTDSNSRALLDYLYGGSGGGGGVITAPGGFVSVMQYGAVGDGVTNDAPAIQAAFDANLGIVVFPRGKTFAIGTRLLLKARTTIMAYGATILRLPQCSHMVRNFRETAFDGVNDDYPGYSGRSNLTILGGTWDNNKVLGQGGNTFTFAHCGNVTVRDATFIRNGDHVFDLPGVEDALFDNCYFHGFLISETHKEVIQIDSCIDGAAAMRPLDGTPTRNVTVRNCHVGPYTEPGGKVWASAGRLVGSHTVSDTGVGYDNIQVLDCTIDGVQSRGVSAYSWTNSRIAGNKIKGAGTFGVAIVNDSTVGSSSVVVEDNIIGECGSQAIRVVATGSASMIRDVSIRDNTLTDTDTSAISVSTSTNTLVTGNKVRGAGMVNTTAAAIDISGDAIDPSIMGNMVSTKASGPQTGVGLRIAATVTRPRYAQNHLTNGLTIDDQTSSGGSVVPEDIDDIANAVLSTSGSNPLALAVLGRGPFIDVRANGAKGDGIADDTTAIRAALNLIRDGNSFHRPGAGSIYLRPGVYRTTSELSIYRGTTLLGEGATLKRDHAGYLLLNGDRGANYPAYTGHGDLRLFGIILDNDGSRVTGTASTFAMAHAENVSFERVTFRDATSHAIDLCASRNVRVRDCIFEGYLNKDGNTYVEAIQLDVAVSGGFNAFGTYDGTPAENVTVDGCVFRASAKLPAHPRGVGSHGGRIDRPYRNIRIRGCNFIDTTNVSIRPFNWMDVDISENVSTNATGFVLVTTPPVGDGTSSNTQLADGTQTGASIASYGIRIVNNTIISANLGIRFSGQATGQFENCLVSGNRFNGGGEGPASPAIEADYFRGLTVTDNFVRSWNGDGMSFGGTGVGSSDLAIANNSVRSASGNGYLVQGTTDIRSSMNESYGVGGASPGTYSHFRFTSSCVNITLAGNQARAIPGDPNRAAAGLSITGSCSGVVRTGNNWKGSGATSVSDSSTGSATPVGELV